MAHKKNLLSEVAILCLLAAVPLLASADDKQDRNLAVLKTLYTKLANSVSVSGNVLGPGHSFFIMASPGIAIDPSLDMQKADDRVLLGKFANDVPYPSWMFQDSGLSLIDVYRQVLDHHDVAKVVLSVDQQKTLASAKSVLFKPDGTKSLTVSQYEAYKSQYDSAVDALAAAQLKAQQTGIPVKQSVRTNVANAANDLVTLGHKNEVEAAQQNYRSLTDLDPQQYFAGLSNSFTSNVEVTLSGEVYPTTNLTPRFESWSTGGWTGFTMDDQDVLTTASSTITSIGGGGSVGFGLWSVGANYNEQTTKTHDFSDIKTFNISAKVRYVRVDRPGVQPLVFKLRNWRWDSSQGGNALPISDGADLSSGKPPSGLMPLYVTGLLVSKEVTLTGDWNTTELDTYHKHVDAGGSVGWGPFSVSGHYSKDESNKTFHGQFTANGVYIPDTEIIGYFCDVLPQSPSPDPTLVWVPPLKLMDYPALANVKFLKSPESALAIFKSDAKKMKPLMAPAK